jgi:plastocyanin
MKKLFLLILFVLAAVSVTAETDFVDTITGVSQQIQGNAFTGPLATLFGDQRINVYITLANGEELVLGMITEDKIVTGVATASVTDSTLQVFTSETTLATIAESTQPLTALQIALDNEEITYEVNGFWNSLRLALFSVFTSFADIPEETPLDVSLADQVGEPVITEPEEGEDEVEEVENDAEDVLDSERPQVHTVTVSTTTFAPLTLIVAVGDTVKWDNVREGSLTDMMIIGTQTCIDIKSGLVPAGQSYEYTFREARTCTIVDGIYTTMLPAKITAE